MQQRHTVHSRSLIIRARGHIVHHMSYISQLAMIKNLTCLPQCADVLLFTLGNTQLKRSAVYSISPEVGPLSGGTDIALQVMSNLRAYLLLGNLKGFSCLVMLMHTKYHTDLQAHLYQPYL